MGIILIEKTFNACDGHGFVVVMSSNSLFFLLCLLETSLVFICLFAKCLDSIYEAKALIGINPIEKVGQKVNGKHILLIGYQ